jgi:hypothetical protein
MLQGKSADEMGRMMKKDGKGEDDKSGYKGAEADLRVTSVMQFAGRKLLQQMKMVMPLLRLNSLIT